LLKRPDKNFWTSRDELPALIATRAETASRLSEEIEHCLRCTFVSLKGSTADGDRAVKSKHAISGLQAARDLAKDGGLQRYSFVVFRFGLLQFFPKRVITIRMSPHN